MVLLLCSTLLLASILVLAFWWYDTQLKHTRLNNLTGPKPLPLLGNALELGRTPSEVLRTLTRWREEYGRNFRFAAGNKVFYVLSDAAVVEKILSSNVHITKADTYKLVEEWLGNGLLLSTGDKWRSRRKIITPTFHFAILENFMNVFNECGDILLKKLSKSVEKPIDVYDIIRLYSLDILCETSMGAKIEAQTNPMTEFSTSVRGLLLIFTNRMFSAWKTSNTLFKFSSLYKDYTKYITTAHEFSLTLIRKRRKELSEEVTCEKLQKQDDEGVKKKIAFLDLLLKSEKENKMSDADIREETDTFIFEGHDTTTSGISLALYALANNPEVQQKLYEEIMLNLGQDLNPSMQRIQDMKYLGMVVREAQRMYPTVPFIIRRIEKDDVIGGIHIPSGVSVMVYIYGQHHDEKYFPNPEQFDPERFLPERQSERPIYAFIPFSAGPRGCIGQKFALLEMKTCLIKIVRNFVLEPVPEKKPILGFSGVLSSENGIYVKLKERKVK